MFGNVPDIRVIDQQVSVGRPYSRTLGDKLIYGRIQALALAETRTFFRNCRQQVRAMTVVGGETLWLIQDI